MEMEMEGKSNGVTKVAKGDASGCRKPVEDPSLSQALALMEGNTCSKGRETKEGGDNQLQGEGVIVKKQHVAMAMGMEVLDCPVCSNPLSPPIFQCALGHFVCSNCRDKLVGTNANKVCSVCSRAVSTRCHGMERVVDSIVVPCSYAVHVCGNTMTYHKGARGGVPARAMLLPGERLWLRGHDGGPPGSLQCPSRVADDTLPVLQAIRRPRALPEFA